MMVYSSGLLSLLQVPFWLRHQAGTLPKYVCLTRAKADGLGEGTCASRLSEMFSLHL